MEWHGYKAGRLKESGLLPRGGFTSRVQIASRTIVHLFEKVQRKLFENSRLWLMRKGWRGRRGSNPRPPT